MGRITAEEATRIELAALASRRGRQSLPQVSSQEVDRIAKLQPKSRLKSAERLCGIFGGVI